jgi:hypothetical protein
MASVIGDTLRFPALSACRPPPSLRKSGARIRFETVGGWITVVPTCISTERDMSRIVRPRYYKGGQVMSGISLNRTSLRSRHLPSSAHFFLLFPTQHKNGVDYVPQWFPLSAHKSTHSRPTSADSPEIHLYCTDYAVPHHRWITC